MATRAVECRTFKKRTPSSLFLNCHPVQIIKINCETKGKKQELDLLGVAARVQAFFCTCTCMCGGVGRIQCPHRMQVIFPGRIRDGASCGERWVKATIARLIFFHCQEYVIGVSQAKVGECIWQEIKKTTRTDFVQGPAALIRKEKIPREKSTQRSVFMTDNLSRLDPTPKRIHRAEVSGRILTDCYL